MKGFGEGVVVGEPGGGLLWLSQAYGGKGGGS